MLTNDDVKKLKELFVIKSEFNEGLRKLENKIESSNEKWHSKIFNLIDSLAKEIHKVENQGQFLAIELRI